MNATTLFVVTALLWSVVSGFVWLWIIFSVFHFFFSWRRSSSSRVRFASHGRILFSRILLKFSCGTCVFSFFLFNVSCYLSSSLCLSRFLWLYVVVYKYSQFVCWLCAPISDMFRYVLLFVSCSLAWRWLYWLVAKYNFAIIIRSMRLLPPFHSLWQRRLYLSYLSMIPTHPTSNRGARLFFERLHTLKSSLYSYTIHLTQNLTRYFSCNTLVIWKCKNKW